MIEAKYIWDCSRVKVLDRNLGVSDFVYRVDWKLIAKDIELNNYKDVIGVTFFNQLAEDEFISLDELTNTQVTQWVIDDIGTDKMLTYMNQLYIQLLRERFPDETEVRLP